MALSAGTVSIGVKPDTTGFGSLLHSGVMGASSGIGTTGKMLGGLLLGGIGAAMAGIGAIVTVGMGEVLDASKGTAQLEAGIKSTGNAAHVSVQGMNDLASSVQGYSGQTDDSIVASENLLLTFTNIKNVGPNKIFDDATRATADMAAKMGGDASSKAILLGKALNDPVKGITALTRVGVSFSQGQKDSIAAMVKSGDTMGAQKVILGELNKEFGGAAEAAGKSLPGQIDIAKRSFEDLSQSVMTGIMPALSTGLSGINTFTKGVQKSFNEGGISKVFTDLGTKIQAALPGIQSALGRMGTAMWEWIQKAVPPMLVKLGELWVKVETWIWGTALPALVTTLGKWGRAFIDWIGPMIPPLLAKLSELLSAFGGWVTGTAWPYLVTNIAKWANAFIDWIGPMIVPFLVKIGTLLSALGGWIINTGVPWIVDHLKQWASSFIGWIGPMIPPFLLALGGLLLKLGAWILTVALPAIISKLAQWAASFAAWVPGAALLLLGKLAGLLVSLGAWILTTALPAIVVKIAQWAVAFLKWVADVIVSLPGKLVGLLGVIVTWAAGVPGKIVSALGDLAKLLLQKGKDVIQGFWDGMTAVFDKIKEWVGGIATWIKEHKGPLSLDSKLLTPAGTAIMEGFHQGLKDGFVQVQASVTAMTGSIASGASQWIPTIQAVLTALGQPLTLTAAVTRLIMKESGGNPNAINLTDSNAAAGHPSQGLIQTIPSTFAAYAGQYASRGITDPFANIYAGLSYALSRYGSIAAVDPLNHAGGYAKGTNSAMPGVRWVGESGPELVRFKGGEKVTPNNRLRGGDGATGADIRALADRIHASLQDQARTIQTLQRTFAGTR